MIPSNNGKKVSSSNIANLDGSKNRNKEKTNCGEDPKILRKSSSISKNLNQNTVKTTVGGAQVANIDINSKKRTNGYCECCKQRYDNLKQVEANICFKIIHYFLLLNLSEFIIAKHLTSLQHENFGHNPMNFKEIDKLVDGVLNFRQFLSKKKNSRSKISFLFRAIENDLKQLKRVSQLLMKSNPKRQLKYLQSLN